MIIKTRARSAGVSLVELLIVLVMIVVLAGLLGLVSPYHMKARYDAYRVTCTNNLKELGKLAQRYSDDHARLFPVAEGSAPPAYASLQLIFDTHRDLPPELVICPSSQDVEAEEDEDGKVLLDSDTSSYAWIARPTRNNATGKKALGSDDSMISKTSEENHDGGLNVLFCDLRVTWVPIDELPADRFLPAGLVGNEGI